MWLVGRSPLTLASNLALNCSNKIIKKIKFFFLFYKFKPLYYAKQDTNFLFLQVQNLFCFGGFIGTTFIMLLLTEN